MKKLPIVLCFILFVSLCVSLYYNLAAHRHILTESDTIVFRDTLVYNNPIPITKDSVIVHHHTERIPVFYSNGTNTDTIFKDRLIVRVDTITDSVQVEVPIVQKEYADSTYHAWVSGYHAALDSIAVFPKTTVITNTQMQTVTKKTKWGLGVQVGVGLTPQKIQPYLGVGVHYNIFSW